MSYIYIAAIYNLAFRAAILDILI